MAKSVRSSVRKRNSTKLRSTVFGPAADARTARLSAKLQELASQPRPENKNTKNANVEMDTSGTGIYMRFRRASFLRGKYLIIFQNAILP